MTLFRTLACALATGLAAGQTPGAPLNPSFELGEPGATPGAWLVPSVMIDQGFEAAIEEGEGATDGARVVRLGFGGEPGELGWGNILQSIDATPYRGQHIELTADIRVDRAAPGDRVQMWMRVDRAGGELGFFDNSSQNPSRSATWTTATITGEVAQDAQQIALGFMVFGGATARIDNVRLRALGDAGAGNVVAAPLEGRGLDHVEAAVRLAGTVRWFHPTTAAREADWDRLTIDLIDAAEAAGSPEELASTLSAHLAPHTMGVQVWAGGPGDAPRALRHAMALQDSEQIAGILHLGLGPNLDGFGNNNIYRSELIVEPNTDARGRRLPPGPLESMIALPGGVSARVPHLLPAPGAREPAPEEARSVAPAIERPAHWRPTVNDRSARLASVGIAWGVLAHFYPYWDVIETDWDAQLATALARAAEAAGPDDFQPVLDRLIATAQDGHAAAGFRTGARALPIDAVVTDAGVLVVREHLDQPTLEPGDRIVSLGGVPIEQLLEAHRERISASTIGYANHRALAMVLTSLDAPGVEAVLERPDRERVVTTLATTDSQSFYRDRNKPRHTLGEEIAPGIIYVNLDGLAFQGLQPLLPKLANAQGVVFDLRGYPDSAGKEILHHLTTERIHSAFWRVPEIVRPRLASVTYSESRWTIMPREPHIDPTRVAFITGPGAISYAESVMAIVEAYGLGTIIGDTTAGTNGNINRFTLPTGQTLIWTGMRVVKHDGRTVHQGVGVVPDIPVSHTAAGLAAGVDEPLQRAIDLLLAAP
ncbi:MAG: S41 family peptidase [Planctomycetota bacterium]